MAENIIHWGTDGIAGVACGAGARWPGAFLVSNRDRERVTCYSCKRTRAFNQEGHMETRIEWAVETVWDDDTVERTKRPNEAMADSMVEFALTKTIDKGGFIKSVTKKKRTVTIGDWEDA